MNRFFIWAMLALVLSICAGPRIALAAGDDELASQPNPAPRIVVADASTTVPPITESQLATPATVTAAPTPATPSSTVTTPAASIAPVQNTDGSWNFVPLANGLQAFMLSALAAVGMWVLSQVGTMTTKYLGVHVDAKEIVTDLGVDVQATNAVKNIIGIVEQKTGWTPDLLKDVQLKNVFLQMAAGLLFKQYPEVWTWLENQEGNALTWIEGKLDKAAAPAPLTIEQAKAAVAATATPTSAPKPAG